MSLQPPAAEKDKPASGSSGRYIPSPDHPQDEYFELTCDDKSLGVNVSGIEISSLEPGGWAEKAGLTVDDEIRKLNGVELVNLSRQEKLKMFRSKRPIQLSIKRPFLKDKYYSLSLEGEDVSLGLGFRDDVISKVRPDGWAAKQRVKVGDVIVSVDGVEFRPATEQERVEVFKRPRPLKILLKRPAALLRDKDTKKHADRSVERLEKDGFLTRGVDTVYADDSAGPGNTDPGSREIEGAGQGVTANPGGGMGWCTVCCGNGNEGKTEIKVKVGRDKVGFS